MKNSLLSSSLKHVLSLLLVRLLFDKKPINKYKIKKKKEKYIEQNKPEDFLDFSIDFLGDDEAFSDSLAFLAFRARFRRSFFFFAILLSL